MNDNRTDSNGAYAPQNDRPEAMTNEREAEILDRFVAGINGTDLDLLVVKVLADLIGALLETDEEKILARLAAAHVLLDALEMEHGDTSEYEAQFLSGLEQVFEEDNEEEYDDDDL